IPREDRDVWKSSHFLKIIQLLGDYPKCFIVREDNVGSKQMQQIRMSLRGKVVVPMGENTMMCKAIGGHLENNPEDINEIRDMLLANKVPAAACAGAIARREVTVPKTSFFQALGVTTKISRGTVEILIFFRPLSS
uniref:Large ribosomal subunit protein uL10 n=1 Tax=Cavia porcellus TaxID=10141 RepID=A0A286Y419_CAVPO